MNIFLEILQICIINYVIKFLSTQYLQRNTRCTSRARCCPKHYNAFSDTLHALKPFLHYFFSALLIQASNLWMVENNRVCRPASLDGAAFWFGRRFSLQSMALQPLHHCSWQSASELQNGDQLFLFGNRTSWLEEGSMRLECSRTCKRCLNASHAWCIPCIKCDSDYTVIKNTFFNINQSSQSQYGHVATVHCRHDDSELALLKCLDIYVGCARMITNS